MKLKDKIESKRSKDTRPASSSKLKRTGNPLLDMGLELEAMPQNPEWPKDGAAQHDHYLYATAKR